MDNFEWLRLFQDSVANGNANPLEPKVERQQCCIHYAWCDATSCMTGSAGEHRRIDSQQFDGSKIALIDG
jgi:hypothetical protein